MARFAALQFAQNTYQARSRNAINERLVNLYLASNPSGAKAPITLYGTPGLKLKWTIGDGPIRGMHFMNHLYVVSGNELYAISKNGKTVLLGKIASTGHVHMIDNGTHIGIATAHESYAANLSGVLQLPESKFNGAAYQDGYGIFSQAGTEKFWITGLDDMTTINALDFSSADVFADVLVGCISDHRELWLFGESTIEVWYNSGNSSFPFVRAQGGFMETGCLSPNSIAKAQNAVFWLGDDFAVYAASGYQPKVISTPPIEKLIKERSSPHTSAAFTYRQEGHAFYCLSFRDRTIVYDITSGIWHERESEGAGRWRPNCYEYAYEKHLVGDYSNGKIYELDLDYYSDDGDEIICEAISPPIYMDGNRAIMHEFILNLEGGIGLTTGQGSAPSALLSWSDNGGRSYSNQISRSIGLRGEYGHVTKWARLGAFRERYLKLNISDPIKRAITGAASRSKVLG